MSYATIAPHKQYNAVLLHDKSAVATGSTTPAVQKRAHSVAERCGEQQRHSATCVTQPCLVLQQVHVRVI